MSTAKFNTWQNPNGTENYKCRSWVNFNGTTTPPTIRASGNVSSVTRNAGGDYSVNFTTAMPDANYVAVVSGTMTIGSSVLGNAGTGRYAADTASVARVYTFDANFAPDNAELVNVAIFR
jgi:hypothetical protein